MLHTKPTTDNDFKHHGNFYFLFIAIDVNQKNLIFNISMLCFDNHYDHKKTNIFQTLNRIQK